MPRRLSEESGHGPTLRQHRATDPDAPAADLRDWEAADDLVHLVIECVEGFDLRAFAINERGTGSEQYPPAMLLSLRIDCYANGLFSSPRIGAASHRAGKLPEELARRENLKKPLEGARARLEEQAAARTAKERAEYERKLVSPPSS